MTDERWESEFARLVDENVTGTNLGREGIDSGHGPEVLELLDTADLLWEAAHGAPPLAQDPVAAMLGLVPDSSRSLNARALKRAMHTAGLKPSSLAARLTQRGWDVAPRDVFDWQARSNAAVPPALIQAIAEVVGVKADDLIIDQGGAPAHQAFQSVVSSPAFSALAERWARLRGTSVELGASALEARLAASVYRGTPPSDEQMLASLAELVKALESQRDADRDRAPWRGGL
ncbi:MAG: hypothetical protein IPH03_02295 [Tetrasphaera sp.]|nr:hypothetical protein [Tetrasphaera sp.]